MLHGRWLRELKYTSRHSACDMLPPDDVAFHSPSTLSSNLVAGRAPRPAAATDAADIGSNVNRFDERTDDKVAPSITITIIHVNNTIQHCVEVARYGMIMDDMKVDYALLNTCCAFVAIDFLGQIGTKIPQIGYTSRSQHNRLLVI